MKELKDYIYESIMDDDNVTMSRVENSILISRANQMLKTRVKDPELIKELESKVAVYPVDDKNIDIIIDIYVKLAGNKCSLNWIDTSNVTNMGYIFTDSQFNGDISKWNTSKVEDMYLMFSESKFNGDISKWDVSKVKDMRHMFSRSKFNRDISKWDVSKVEDTANMFDNCPIRDEYKPKFR